MPLSKKRKRRYAARQKAISLLEDFTQGRGDPYVSFAGLYGLWCSNNAAVEELRPLFRIDGINPGSRVSLDAAFMARVLPVASAVLAQMIESLERIESDRGAAKQ